MSAQYTSLKRGVNADVEHLWHICLYPNDHFSDQRNTFICCLWILNTYSLWFPFWKSFQDRHDYRNKAIQKCFCNKQSYHNAAWWIQLCVLDTPPLMGVRNHLNKPLGALHISLHFSSYFQIEDFSLVTRPIALSGAGFFTKFMSPPFILSCNTFSSMFSSFKSPKAGENYLTPWLLCKTCCTFLSLVLRIIHICVWLSTHQPTDPLVI